MISQEKIIKDIESDKTNNISITLKINTINEIDTIVKSMNDLHLTKLKVSRSNLIQKIVDSYIHNYKN